MTICGQLLYDRRGDVAAICTQPWGVEHDHNIDPTVRVYEPDREPDDVTVAVALRMIENDSIYQEDDGTFWLRPGLIWEDAKEAVNA